MIETENQGIWEIPIGTWEFNILNRTDEPENSTRSNKESEAGIRPFSWSEKDPTPFSS